VPESYNSEEYRRFYGNLTPETKALVMTRKGKTKIVVISALTLLRLIYFCKFIIGIIIIIIIIIIMIWPGIGTSGGLL
jgi:hypothetical protein